MALSAGLLLKGLGGLLAAAASVSLGTWYLATKDKVTWTDLDTEAFKADGSDWKWNLTLGSDSTSQTLTASAVFSKAGSEAKTWTCKIVGIFPNGESSTDTDEIKKQFNEGTDSFKEKTGLPGVPTNGDAQNWTRPTESGKISALEKFFENCIRNRTDAENKAVTANKADSTIKLKLEKTTGDKYKFKDDKFKKLYGGVVYSIQ